MSLVAIGTGWIPVAVAAWGRLFRVISRPVATTVDALGEPLLDEPVAVGTGRIHARHVQWRPFVFRRIDAVGPMTRRTDGRRQKK